MSKSIICFFSLLLPFAVSAQVPVQPKTKIMVVLQETLDGKSVSRKSVSTALEKSLLEAGYDLVDQSQIEKLNEQDLAASRSNPVKAAELGKQSGAEIVINGIAELNLMDEKEIYGVLNILYECQVDVKAINTSTAEIIYSSNSSSTRAAQGKMKAAADAGKFAADKLAKEMTDQFKKRIASKGSLAGSSLQLKISGANNQQLQEFEKSLSLRKQVKSFVLRYMDGPAAVYDLEYEGGLPAFRSDFSQITRNFSIIGIGSNRADLKYGQFGAAKGEEALSMLDEPPVDIVGFDFPDIFPANLSYYASNPLGSLSLKNNLDQDMKNIKIRINIPEYMNLPVEQVLPVLKSGDMQSVSVSLIFNALKLQEVNKEVFTQAKIEIIYFLRGKEMIRELVRPVVIHDRNALSWNDPRAIGAFITPTNRAVADATRKFISAAGRETFKDIPVNLKNAVAIWSGLNLSKINYIQDPRSAVSAQVLDYIQYPNEVLNSRSGDCDDSSVLLASCLENVNIPTALILTSDHIFVMFNSGVAEKNWEMVSPVKENLVFMDGTVWVPVETTLMHLPFKTAWEMGAREYASAKSADPGFKVLKTAETWSVFSPSSLESGLATNLPSDEAVSNGIKKEMTILTSSSVDVPDGSIESTIRLAKLKAGQSDFDGAFQVLNSLDSATASVKNAKGNISLLAGKTEEALSWFKLAMAADQKDGGLDFNMGFLFYFTGDTATAVGYFATGIEKLGGEEKAGEILGINLSELGLSTRGADKGNKQVSSTEIRGLMQKALASRKRPGHTVNAGEAKLKDSKNILAYGGRLSADPTQAKSLVTLLYWKF